MTVSINPRLDEWELFSFVSDTENWSMLDAIAKHSSAWPELASWVVSVKQHPKAASPPPEPSEPRKRRVLPHRAYTPLVETTDSEQITTHSSQQDMSDSNAISRNEDPDPLRPAIINQAGTTTVDSSPQPLHDDGESGISTESIDLSIVRDPVPTHHRFPVRLVVVVLVVALFTITGIYTGITAWHAREHGIALSTCAGVTKELHSSKKSW